MFTVDRQLIGTTSAATTVEVEKGAIRRFAQALGDTNPLYWDEAAAQAAGFRSLVAPPTFPVTLGRNPIPGLTLPSAGMIHGEQEFQYGEPIVAGDVITITTTLADVKSRSGSRGHMTILTFKTEGVNQAAKPVFISRAVVIVTEAVAES